MKKTIVTILVGAALVAAGIFLLRDGASRQGSVRVVSEGIAIGFDVEPLGEEASVAITLTEANSGKPLPGLRPLAWMARAPGGTCNERIRGYLGGLLAARPEVNLNGFLVVTMNDDNSLSVIDPQVAFGRTRLQRMLTLSGKPEDWALTPDGRRLLVTLPAVDRVAVVDTRELRVLGNAPTGKRPGDVAIAPDGRTAWVGNDGERTVTVIDPATGQVRATLSVGDGPHRIAFDEASATAWVASGGSRAVEVYGFGQLAHVGRVDAGFEVAAIAASPLARAIYVAARDGRIHAFEAATRRPLGGAQGAPGLTTLAVDPSGRWLFAAGETGSLAAIDTATLRTLHRWEGLGRPDALGFTEAFVHVRDRSAGRLLAIARGELEKGVRPAPVEVAMGQKAPDAGGGLSLASPFAETPEPGALIVAHPADRALYLYREGMMAPVATHLNYGREPRAALILDRSLREVAPGRHETTTALRGNGTWSVALLLESPRVAVCFDVEVEGLREAPRPAEPALSLTLLDDVESGLAVGRTHEIRFRLVDGNGGLLRADEVGVLLHRAPHNDQQRPRPRALGDNVFAVPFTPTREGTWRLDAAVPSRGARWGTIPALRIPVRREEPLVGKAIP